MIKLTRTDTTLDLSQRPRRYELALLTSMYLYVQKPSQRCGIISKILETHCAPDQPTSLFFLSLLVVAVCFRLCVSASIRSEPQSQPTKLESARGRRVCFAWGLFRCRRGVDFTYLFGILASMILIGRHSNCVCAAFDSSELRAQQTKLKCKCKDFLGCLVWFGLFVCVVVLCVCVCVWDQLWLAPCFFLFLVGSG